MEREPTEEIVVGAFGGDLMSTGTWVQAILLCISFGCLLAAAWILNIIAFLITLSLTAMFFAYVVREVQRDDERETESKADKMAKS